MEKNGKRSIILNAALDLFAEKGFHGAPTSLLAQAAGVGVGTIYRYFKDKDELIRELYREVLERVQARVYGDSPPGLPVRERYVRAMSRLLRFFLENPLEFRFMEQYYFSPFSSDDDCAAPEENETIRQLLITARTERVVKEAHLSVLQALAFGPIVALAKEHINRSLAVDEEMIRQTVEASWDGLKRY
ncbi:TetR/AcrR family transcriptional regulator [Desulfuromonas sp. TF]|uniref:TetR/AcrR family transcriptional regulator n=1 Tax=Desulfuromonas sp. TF TaxID=1232410 RepID=UPI0003FF42B7|nr:TetR/AcrR family transcriptional regulator [Desulfuromonas sp. TF]